MCTHANLLHPTFIAAKTDALAAFAAGGLEVDASELIIARRHDGAAGDFVLLMRDNDLCEWIVTRWYAEAYDFSHKPAYAGRDLHAAVAAWTGADLVTV